MTLLTPFAPTEVKVRAHLERRNGLLQFRYECEGAEIFKPGHWTQFTRADELWRVSCVEAFLLPEGGTRYYELNFSPDSPRWSAYAFDSYREPQPPRATHDLELKELSVERKSLTALVKAPQGAYRYSLTAIVRQGSETHYFALRHAGVQPDFHDPNGFTGSLPDPD